MLDATPVPPARGLIANANPSFVVPRPTGGINSNVDAADIEDNMFVSQFNTRNRYDRSFRRPGTSLVAIPAPDASPVRKIFWSSRIDQTQLVLRVSEVGIYRLGAGGWLPYTGSPATIGKMVFVSFIYRKAIIADGLNKLMYLGSTDVVMPPSAPVAEFITGFNNRVIAASIKNDSDGPIMVMWSSVFDGTDASLENFDFSVNRTAGFEKLIASPSDISDKITGLQALTNYMIVTRQRSVWVGVNQESPFAPFRFYNAIPGIGCDLPNSLRVVRDGVVFADTRTKNIYHFVPGGDLKRLADLVSLQMFDDIKQLINDKAVEVHSDYDPHANEYYIKVLDKIYTYNFDTEAWSCDRNTLTAQITAMVNFDEVVTIGLQIDELIGTIDNLIGTIDEQTIDSFFIPGQYRFYGLSNGVMYYESLVFDTDYGDSFESIWESKDFSVPYQDILVNRLLIEYESTKSNPVIKLEFSTDAGTTWRTSKTAYQAEMGKSKLIIMNQLIKARRFRWRLSVLSGDFSMLRYEVHTSGGGASFL